METPNSPQATLLDDPRHNLPFLEWVQFQAEEISKFSDIIDEIIEEEAKRSVVSLAKVNECLAKYTWFFTTQTAFYQIYKKRKSDLEKEAKALYDTIYLDTKRQVTDPTSDVGKRYVKKAATMDEIKREAASHSQWRKYRTLETQIEELNLKIRAQLRNLNIIGKLDINLQVLKKQSEKEIKYLYLQ